ncbi:MAG: spermidine/putrescine ABC transporter substrate-binding protein [Kiritimatiellae bacterium]|nr:spermidine/putrescine ABC transporter substrate-binding protein [Kiritimatiellia bacterium]
MKKNIKFVAGLVLALAVLAGCGPAKKELHVYTWSDYINSDVIAQFEKDFNCRVVIDTFDSNESMFAKLQAGSTGYDIIMPTSYLIPVMARNKMIVELDKSKLPNVTANFDKAYYSAILDKTMKYNVPYAVTYTGIVYRKSKVKGAKLDSWKTFEMDSIKGRIAILNDMRETIGAALKTLGKSLNTTNKADIDAAVELVLKWKKNVAKFDNEQYKTAVASGELIAGHGYSSDCIQIAIDSDDIEFFLPKEGFAIACDEMVLSSTSKNSDLAHAFINFLYDEKVAKENMEYISAPMPVAPALKALTPELKKFLCLAPEVLARGEVLVDFDDKPEIRDLYIKAWDKIKSGK